MITNQYNIDVTGQAPVEVKYIYLNGTNAPLEWTNITAWKITVGLQLGTNVLTVVGYDRKIKPLGSNDTGTFTNTIKVVSY